MRSLFVLPALAALSTQASAASSTTDIPADANPTPDALDLGFLRNVVAPTYTTIDGQKSQDVPFATASAIAAVVADQTETPLSVFPAVTSIAINAAGEDDAAPAATATPTASKRGLPVQKRNACDPQPTIANYYNVDASTYDKFKADAKIASVANGAVTPAGYTNNFKNKGASNSAYGYLGYTVLETGYDVDACAKQCNQKEGCLGFNIFFERDPTQEPGYTSCKDPAAFANIKCTFWGSALDLSTATNDGQWRADFHVGIAGSNAYTSDKVGGYISDWTEPLSLNDATMNTPLRDCGDTWTYLGSKLFQEGAFDVNLCAAACDAQTTFNLAHPPSSGYTPVCAAFGTYLLTKTDSTGAKVLGQMCTMYTSGWGSEYAVNKASYDDSIGAKYTYSYSYFYSKSTLQPVCESDLSYLRSSGADFCTAYIGYTEPVSTTTATTTPAGFVTQYTTIATQTSIAATVTGNNVVWKRAEESAAALITANISTVANLPTNSIAILSIATVSTLPANGTDFAKRAAPATPASITSWPDYKISAACSRVATGTSTKTETTTAPPLTTTASTTALVTATCTAPPQNAALFAWTPIWGNWDSSLGQPAPNTGGAKTGQVAALQLPFAISAFDQTTATITVATDGYIKIGDATLSPYSGLGGGLYIYSGALHGVFYRISGAVGSRVLTFGWFAGTIMWGHQATHITATFYEGQKGKVTYKYYDAFQGAPYGNIVSVYAQKGAKTTWAVPQGTTIDPGFQFDFQTNADGSATVSKSLHDRVECCLKGWWHACTEFTGV